MIIRLSEKKDIYGIVSLWHEAFGDDENDIMFFMDKRYIPENTLVAEENGEIASMLFLFDGKMSVKGIDYPSYYLYAACTLYKYRGKGLMAKLLDYAKNIAESRGYDYICLMPGEKSLFNYYEKHGYKTVFSKKVLTLNTDCSKNNDLNINNDNDNYEKIRNKTFEKFDYFKWDNQSVKFASEFNEYYSGYEFKTCEGYCLYSTNDGVLSVKEFAFTPNKLCSVINRLAFNHKCNKAIINLPADYETDCGEYIIQPCAMLLCVNKHSFNAVKYLSNAYLGLTLD